jgi:FAD/FMN-containing dehydrogenase
MNHQQFEQLQTNLSGKLITAGDADYETARKVYNGMIDKHPDAIAQCADVADVISCVNFAREYNMLLAIRSGSHNGGSLGICDDEFLNAEFAAIVTTNFLKQNIRKKASQ